MAGQERVFPQEPSEDRLRRLEERLDRASAAAERLVAEAAASAVSGAADREPPPAGWQMPDSEDAGRSDRELDALVALLRSLRDLIPSELQQRLIAALREVLEAIRAVLDWYLERLDRGRTQPAEVQDIPIL